MLGIESGASAAGHRDTAPLPAAGYKSRAHPDSVREAPLAEQFAAHARTAVAQAGQALDRDLGAAAAELQHSAAFAPLMIRGLDCLRLRTECLGDCPDAAYFGP